MVTNLQSAVVKLICRYHHNLISIPRNNIIKYFFPFLLHQLKKQTNKHTIGSDCSILSMSSDQSLYESQSIKPGRKFIRRRGALRCWILATFPLEKILVRKVNFGAGGRSGGDGGCGSSSNRSREYAWFLHKLVYLGCESDEYQEINKKYLLD